jgi:hypothetical protein
MDCESAKIKVKQKILTNTTQFGEAQESKFTFAYERNSILMQFI